MAGTLRQVTAAGTHRAIPAVGWPLGSPEGKVVDGHDVDFGTWPPTELRRRANEVMQLPSGTYVIQWEASTPGQPGWDRRSDRPSGQRCKLSVPDDLD